jgi:hypothetical protein
MHVTKSAGKSKRNRATRLSLTLFLTLAVASAASAQSQVIEKWTKSWSGFPTYAVAMTADSQGNVISAGVWGDESFVTKYDTNGNVVRRNWLEGSEVLRGEADSVVVDAAGDIFVLSGLQINPTPTLEPDVALAKYNAAGVRQWVTFTASLQFFHSPIGLAVTPQGEAYVLQAVTPTANNGADVVTTKYDANGKQVWARTEAVAVDQRTQNGTNLTSAVAIRLDALGNVYVAADNGDGGEIFRYDANGNLLKTIGAGTLGVVREYRVDAAGNSYFLGGAANTQDRIVAKFGPDGSLKWLRDLGPQTDSQLEDQTLGIIDDTLKDIGVDAAGDVFILQNLPSVPATPSGTDMAVTKFDANGTEKWTSRFNSSADHSAGDRPQAIAVSSIGEVYLTGGALISPAPETVTIKYSATGEELWVKYLGIQQTGPVAIVLGADGQLFVESMTAGETAYTTDYVQQ